MVGPMDPNILVARGTFQVKVRISLLIRECETVVYLCGSLYSIHVLMYT